MHTFLLNTLLLRSRLGPSCWKMRSMRARSNSTIYKGGFNFGNLWQFWHFWQS